MRLSHRSARRLLLLTISGTLTGYAADRSAVRNALAAQKPVGVASPSGPVIVHNAYYPKPGMEEDVYRLRLRASAVRAQLGLVEGRVLRRIEGPEGAAHVIWEAEYPDSAARADDVARLSRSAEFDAIQKEMGTFVVRFERSVW